MKSEDILRQWYEASNKFWKFIKKHADCKDKPDSYWDACIEEAKAIEEEYKGTPLATAAHNTSVTALLVIQAMLKGE